MLAYTTHGSGPGTPLLIAHGLYGAGRNWGVIAKRLSDTRTVVTVDMRNPGPSFWDDANSFTALAGDLAQVIDSIGTPMDVVGHSMGGKAAMVLSHTRPDTLRRLVIGDIAPISVNGVTTSICPARAKSISPCAMGMSIWRGELVLMMV